MWQCQLGSLAAFNLAVSVRTFKLLSILYDRVAHGFNIYNLANYLPNFLLYINLINVYNAKNIRIL